MKQQGKPNRTSLSQIADMFKKIQWQPNTINLDYGGGAYDKSTDYLAEKGVQNFVFDTFARGIEENKRVAEFAKNHKFDTTTCFNVLNVVDNKDAQESIVRKCAKCLKKDGISYFQIYNSGKKGSTKIDTYQDAENIDHYLPFFEKYYNDVKLLGKKYAICRNPKDIKTTDDWYFDEEQTLEKGTQFSLNNPFGILMF